MSEIFTNMKKCSRCKEEKPRTNDYFKTRRASKDGYNAACKQCLNKNIEKNNLEEIKSELKEFGLELVRFNKKRINPSYIGNRDEVTVICYFEHKKTTKFLNIKNSGKCVECERLKPFYEFVSVAEQEGYKMISNVEEYTRAKDGLKLICPKEHHCVIDKNHFVDSGRRCPKCKGEKIRRNRMTPIDEVEESFHVEDYKILDGLDNYSNSLSRFTVSCPNNHVYETSVGNFRAGYRCNTCFRDYYIGSNNVRWKGYNDGLILFFRRTVTPWRQSTIEKHSGKCVLTGSENIDVHHLTSFMKIVELFSEEYQIDLKKSVSSLTDSELLFLRKAFLEYHNQYGLGVCIDRELHKNFHSLYGKIHNTPEQFQEFVEMFNKNLVNKQFLNT